MSFVTLITDMKMKLSSSVAMTRMCKLANLVSDNFITAASLVRFSRKRWGFLVRFSLTLNPTHEKIPWIKRIKNIVFQILLPSVPSQLNQSILKKKNRAMEKLKL